MKNGNNPQNNILNSPLIIKKRNKVALDSNFQFYLQ